MALEPGSDIEEEPRPFLGSCRIIRSLRKHDVEFVILGASAAIAQGAPIGTIDLDIGYRRTRCRLGSDHGK